MLLALAILALLLSACAAETGKKERPVAKPEPLAVIQISKTLPASSGDCPVSVTILNRMQGTAWDGVSYHVAMLDHKQVSIGQLLGAPRQVTQSGGALADGGKILGVKCQDIADVSLLYFAYYPSGKNAVHLHNSEVKAELK